jgi:mRNA-degrading endonuclease RelE of RelBE toxin-antitoxin system
MYSPEDTLAFGAIMKKLAKKDRVRFERVRKKVGEILQNPNSYEPLGNIMAGTRHAHIDPYVLVFRVDEAARKVIFLDFDHHDRIYRN